MLLVGSWTGWHGFSALPGPLHPPRPRGGSLDPWDSGPRVWTQPFARGLPHCGTGMPLPPPSPAQSGTSRP